MPTKNVLIDRSKHLTLVVCNTQSIKNKDTLLLDHLVNVKLDLCLITDTWLSNSDDAWIATSDIMCNGYKLSNVNRNHKRGGGLALAYKNNLDVKLSLHGQSHSFEYAVWKCNISNMLLTLVGIYHPPYSDMTKVTDAMFLDGLAEFLETTLTTYSNIVVSGDFNLHIDDISNLDAQVFLDLMTVFGLQNHVHFKMHISGHTLDLILNECISQVSIKNVEHSQFLLDHLSIVAHLSVDKTPLKKKECNYRKINKIDLDDMSHCLEEAFESFENDDLDLMVSEYERILNTVLNELAPMKEKTITLKPANPWFTEDIKQQKCHMRN